MLGDGALISDVTQKEVFVEFSIRDCGVYLLLQPNLASPDCIIFQRNFYNSACFEAGQDLHGHFDLTLQNADVGPYLLIQLLRFYFPNDLKEKHGGR